MKKAEALIRKRLLANDSLAKVLATFGGIPAIFYQEAPDDTSEHWDRDQYPRIVFLADTFSDAEHGSRKVLSVDIMCSSTGVAPEKLEPFVRQALESVFFTPEDTVPFISVWRESQAFQAQSGEQGKLIYGITLSFDIYEYPPLITSDPDPITAISRYVQEWDENIAVIGFTELSDVYVPSRNHPAIYFSLSSRTINRQTNTVVWLDAEIVIHLFAPTIQDRIEWLEQLSQSLALDGEIIMLDKSPMFLRQLRGDTAGDEITGQLRLSVQYGLLRRPKYAHTMMHTQLK